jgi:hypothetical protein
MRTPSSLVEAIGLFLFGLAVVIGVYLAATWQP